MVPIGSIWKRPSDGARIRVTDETHSGCIDFELVSRGHVVGLLNIAVLSVFWTRESTLETTEIGCAGAEVNLQRIRAAAQQCASLLQELSAAHPGLTLPGGRYGMPDRRLDRVCNFLVSELRGLETDAQLASAAGDPHLPRE